MLSRTAGGIRAYQKHWGNHLYAREVGRFIWVEIGALDHKSKTHGPAAPLLQQTC